MDFRFLTAAAFVAVLSIANPVVADGFRTWKSQNQKHTVQAKFDDYDADSKQLTLIDRDGKTITIKLDQLSSSDQQHVVRRHKRLVAEKNAADNPFKVAGNETTNKPSRSGRSAGSARKETPSVARWGIEWTPGLEDAQTAALGNSRYSKDNKPIMWFRVLGNLEKHM